jgi:alginate O-acetyltransferase complex protein AlgI
VYIPLGGSRNNRAYKTYRNLLIVFLLTGIWHGASWNFVIWGLLHGFFLAIEHAGVKHYIPKLWRPFQHVYLLLVVLFAWVFFRAEDLSSALLYCSAMLDFASFSTETNMLNQLISIKATYAFIIGIVFSLPIVPRLFDVKSVTQNNLTQMASLTVLVSGLLYLSLLEISSATFNPFIYFRF